METLLGSDRFARLAAEAAGSLTGTEIATTIDGFDFEIIGQGGDRTALLGPDFVVYKVPVFGDSQCADELEFFRWASARSMSWAPDFWQWSGEVLAMPLYTQYPRYRQRPPGKYSTYLNGFYWHRDHIDVVTEIYEYSDDLDPNNIGLRDNNSLVLLDGGYSRLLGGSQVCGEVLFAR